MTTTDQAGETLIETLVTVAIMAIAASAVLTGVMATVNTSQLHRAQADTQALLRSWAEAVSAKTYVNCPTATDASFPAPPTLPAGFTAQVNQVQYWNPSTGLFDGDRTRCLSSGDSGMQKVRLRIVVPTGLQPGFTTDLAVIVRKPCVSSC